MTQALLEELAEACRSRKTCALVTVAATKGSVPRAAGTKMLVYSNGKFSGTIGGGKFESLVIAEALQQMQGNEPLLKTYPLHESSPNSFGAICGGEVTILIEPQVVSEAIFLIGGGHCAQAIARLALDCGLHVTVVEDRADLLVTLPEAVSIVSGVTPSLFITGWDWKSSEALIIVSRNYEIDREALRASLGNKKPGYLGMIGSSRKVQRVFDELKNSGVPAIKFDEIHAPIGIDIGADSPVEIAISVLAEVLTVLRNRSGLPLKITK